MDPEIQERDKLRLRTVCDQCGKEISTKGTGSLTSWLFADNRCKCLFSEEIEGSTALTVAPQSKQVSDLMALSDRYKIESVLGEGGVGTVYKVHDQILNITLAAKVLHPQFVKDKNAAKRFDLEVKSASSLTHPNLVMIHEQGQTERGAPFYLMDYLDGKNLETVLSEEIYLELKRAINIFVQICDALSYAHAKGIIHRDIKPSNIMLIPAPGGGELVKVLDFGIAKVILPNSKETAKLTQAGELFGSPAYMSPEQCTGSKVDERSDIYSLGCVMYEALTGQQPFLGENPVKTILRHLHADPEPLTKAVPDLEIPEGLNTIVMNALLKNPDERYQSISELLKDLHRLPDGKVKPRRKRKSSKKMLSLMAAAVIASAFVAQYIINQPDWVKYDTQASVLFNEGKIKEAAAAEVKAAEAAEKAHAAPTLILPVYDHAAALLDSVHENDQAIKYYEKGAQTALAVRTPERAVSYFMIIANKEKGLGNDSAELEAYLKLVDAVRVAYGEHDHSYSDATYRTGNAYRKLNDHKKAREFLERSLKSSKGNDHDTWLALSWLTKLSTDDGDLAAAQRYYQLFMPLTDKLYTKEERFNRNAQKQYKQFLSKSKMAVGNQ